MDDDKFTEEAGSEVADDKKVDQAPTETVTDGEVKKPEAEKVVEKAEGEDLTASEQDKVDAAAEQHKNDGTWPEDTPQWVKDRINKITRKRYQDKQKIETLANENSELKKKLEEKENTPEPVGERPSIEDFETEEEYFDALTDWKLDKREEDSRLRSKETTEQTTQEQAQENFNKKMDGMVDAGNKKHEDFLAKITSVPGNLFRTEVVETIMEADNADEVAYFLANDLAEAERISKMNPAQRAISIGKLSVRIANPPPKKTTTAPDPIDAGGTSGSPEVDESKLSDQEWLEMKRNKRMNAA